jgi:YvrJ protein family
MVYFHLYLPLYIVNSFNKSQQKGGELMTPIDIPVWVAIIGNFGFPIAITVYLFVRFERKLGDLEKVIFRLSEAIKEITIKE